MPTHFWVAIILSLVFVIFLVYLDTKESTELKGTALRIVRKNIQSAIHDRKPVVKVFLDNDSREIKAYREAVKSSSSDYPVKSFEFVPLTRGTVILKVYLSAKAIEGYERG